MAGDRSLLRQLLLAAEGQRLARQLLRGDDRVRRLPGSLGVPAWRTPAARESSRRQVAVFSGFMINAWIVASIVAVVAGVVGFFVVLRGSAFVAHAIPNGAFAGAAGAVLVGVDAIVGLGVFSLLGALAIGLLARRGRHDAVTALALVTMLGLGALFLSLSSEYEPAVYSLLFGEVLGISPTRSHHRGSPSCACSSSRCSTGR